jgi:hypothetical protein
MQLDFTNDEMRNFILKTGKYKITNVKCFNPVPGNWYNGFRYTEEEVYVEVAYLIDDIETEKWLFNSEYKRKDILEGKIEWAFRTEMKNKLLNL